MLGADNAIVIALACAALPIALRNRALIMGTAGAVLLRALLLAIAGLLMGLIVVKLIAGLYLLYVGYNLLSEHDAETNVESHDGVVAAVKTIIVADFMMSIDNVMAVAGAAESAGAHSTLYAIAGICFSIPVIVLGAKFLTSLMDRFPIIIWFGAGLLGWVGAEMIVSDAILADYIAHDWELAYKTAGFAAVILTVIASKHFTKPDSSVVSEGEAETAKG